MRLRRVKAAIGSVLAAVTLLSMSLTGVTAAQASDDNLALNQTVTASSYEVATTAPEKAVDGDLGTRWGTAQNKAANEWIEVGLGGTKTVKQTMETVRETANMVSFMADVIGIRDDMYIGKGDAYRPRSPSLSSRPTRTAFWITVPRSSPCSPTPITPRSPLPTCSTSSTSLAAREPQGQEGCRHLGLLALLRQAAVLSAVADQPAAPFWHGRHFGPPRGLRPHARGRRARQGLRRRVRHHL